MKASELRKLSQAELDAKLLEAINQLDNPMRISAVKKDIARVMTLIREAQLNGQNS